MNEENCTPLAGTPVAKNVDKFTLNGSCDSVTQYKSEDVDIALIKTSEWTAAGELYSACYPRVFYQINPDLVSLSPTLENTIKLIDEEVRIAPAFYNANTFNSNEVKVEFSRMAA